MKHIFSAAFGIFVVTQIGRLGQVASFDPNYYGRYGSRYMDLIYGRCFCPDIYQPICATDGYTYPNACNLRCARKYRPNLLGVCEGQCPCCRPAYRNEPLYSNNPYGWSTPVVQPLISSTGATTSPQSSYYVPSELYTVVPYSGNTPVVQVNQTGGGVGQSKRSADTGRYKRDAEMEVTKLGWHFNGALPSSGGCICTDIYMPVCGSNNVTYDNLCEFRCASKKEKCLTLTCEGECPCCSCGKAVIYNKN